MVLHFGLKVGQVGNLRPIGNRPGRAPRKLLRLSYQACMYGVYFNVSGDPVKLSIGAKQPIIAFILPEWTSGHTQDAICLACGKPFQRLHNLSGGHFGSDQHVYVIWHDHEVMEQVLRGIPVLNRFNHHPRDIGSPQMQWPGRIKGKKTVHRQERMARCRRLRKRPISRERAVQAPSYKQRPADFVDMRQPASIEMRHKTSVARFPEFSQEIGVADFQSACRLPTCPTTLARDPTPCCSNS